MGISFTENADFLSAFPWADGHEAKVRDRPLVLIGDFLSPGGASEMNRTARKRDANSPAVPVASARGFPMRETLTSDGLLLP